MLFSLSRRVRQLSTLDRRPCASQMRYPTSESTLALTARLRKTERQARTWMRSFDDLVGAGEDRWRDGEAERLGGIEIDNQLECGRMLNGQIGGLSAFEDLSDVIAAQAGCAGAARSIADQAAGRGVFTPVIDRRNHMACRQRHELVETAVEERVAGENERAGM